MSLLDFLIGKKHDVEELPIEKKITLKYSTQKSNKIERCMWIIKDDLELTTEEIELSFLDIERDQNLKHDS